MGEVVEFPGTTTLDTIPAKILNSALEADLRIAFVIGREQNENFWFSGNISDAYEILWLLEVAKREILDLVEGNEE